MNTPIGTGTISCAHTCARACRRNRIATGRNETDFAPSSYLVRRCKPGRAADRRSAARRTPHAT
ncbi:hypothetical protein WG70_29225 [Burkholderia oklahomensis EO147]|nr:hypothetical protein WG70_29225 [Burkholderia oklahomensis EO147]KUY49201.1 hypothetical protein WG70_19275 [Burkholderia oklahomensis EO147]